MINKIYINWKSYLIDFKGFPLGNLLGICLPSTDTAVANKRPQSAITVSVKGMPINAKHIQNALPPIVTGTILP